MSQFTRIFSGKFQNFGNCGGVKHLTNIMSGDNKDGNDEVEEMILWPGPGCKLYKGI